MTKGSPCPGRGKGIKGEKIKLELIGERIILRQVKESDFDFLYKLDSHPLVYKYEEDSAPTKDNIVERYSKRMGAWL